MRKPEPSDVTRRGGASGRLRSRKSRKNSSNGEPGGNWGTSGPRWARSRLTVVDEMLTTAGRSLWARSANPSGARANAGDATSRVATRNAPPPARAPRTNDRTTENIEKTSEGAQTPGVERVIRAEGQSRLVPGYCGGNKIGRAHV